MYIDTVTIFNRLRRNGTDTWYPTVLAGVDLNVDAAAMRKAYGAETKDRAKLHIRYAPGEIIAGKQYHSPKEWAGEGITFQSGELFDFFMVGAWAGGTVNDEDYLNGFYDYMRKREDVYAITSVAKYSVIPHFEILGA